MSIMLNYMQKPSWMVGLALIIVYFRYQIIDIIFMIKGDDLTFNILSLLNIQNP